MVDVGGPAVSTAGPESATTPSPAVVADRSARRARNLTRVVVLALVFFTVVLLGYPVEDLLINPHPPLARVGGWVGLATVVALHAYVTRAALIEHEAPAWARVAAIAETVLLLVLLGSLGLAWVAVPLFGLADLLLVLSGALRVAAAVATVVVYATLTAQIYGLADWSASGGIWLVFTAVSFGLVALARLTRELAAARTDLAVAAVGDERLRMARDLHDSLGHSLSVVLLKLELAERLHGRDVERSAREVGEASTLLRSSVQEMQDLVTGMRDRSLREEIENAGAVLAAAGVRTRINGPDVTARTPTTDALGWAVREGVTNILRHSCATRCEITVRRADGHVQVTMVNDGARPGPPPGGHGIDGLRERLDGVGGTVSTSSNAGGEFVLTVRAPVEVP